MLTTLRSEDGEHFYLDITVKQDGSVATTLGPIQGKELAQRWERMTLIRHRAWENLLSWEIKGNFARQAMHDLSLKKLVGETDEYTRIPFPAGHQNWMDRHPLTPAFIGEGR